MLLYETKPLCCGMKEMSRELKPSMPTVPICSLVTGPAKRVAITVETAINISGMNVRCRCTHFGPTQLNFYTLGASRYDVRIRGWSGVMEKCEGGCVNLYGINQVQMRTRWRGSKIPKILRTSYLETPFGRTVQLR